MTKKDYELIAKTLKDSINLLYFDTGHDEVMCYKQYKATCLLFANNLASTNPRFDKQRFLTACGI